MKQLGIATAIGMIVASVNIANAAGTHAQGGTLTVPIITQTFVEDFNPYSGAQGDMVSGTMYEPLYVINTLKGDINWRLAESYTYSEDLMSMTIKLKSGLTWSDGQTLNADDLIYSLNLGRDDAKLDATGQWSSKKFSSVEKVNDLTVKINFSAKDGTCLLYTSPSPRDRQKSRMPSSA